MTLAKDTAKAYVNSFTAGGGAFAAATVALPGTSIALTMAEAYLINKVANIYGIKGKDLKVTNHPMFRSLVFKGIMLYGGGSAALKVLSEVLTLVPGIGWLAKPAVASAAVKGFGEVTIAYFESRLPGQEAYCRPAWAEFRAAFGAGTGAAGMVGVDLDDLKSFWNALEA